MEQGNASEPAWATASEGTSGDEPERGTEQQLEWEKEVCSAGDPDERPVQWLIGRESAAEQALSEGREPEEAPSPFALQLPVLQSPVCREARH